MGRKSEAKVLVRGEVNDYPFLLATEDSKNSSFFVVMPRVKSMAAYMR